MEKPKRARRRKPDTAKADLKPLSCRSSEGRVSIARWNPKGMRRSTGPQSMGATPKMNRSAKGGARSSLHYGGEGVLIHPPHQGVCGRHGTEEQRVTSGGLARSPRGSGGSEPISESEVASDAGPVVGRLRGTLKRGESCATEQSAAKWGWGRRSAKVVGESQGAR
jgi:hypothetical protein